MNSQPTSDGVLVSLPEFPAHYMTDHRLIDNFALTQPLPCPTAKQRSILRAPPLRDAHTQMLVLGATIFDQDETLRSAGTTKRWYGTDVRFPKQPSHS